jgi:hypothetical protein
MKKKVPMSGTELQSRFCHGGRARSLKLRCQNSRRGRQFPLPALCIFTRNALFVPLKGPEMGTAGTIFGGIMALLSKVFTTRTLVQIIIVLTAVVMMKAMSAHYDFSWAAALAQG